MKEPNASPEPEEQPMRDESRQQLAEQEFHQEDSTEVSRNKSEDMAVFGSSDPKEQESNSLRKCTFTIESLEDIPGKIAAEDAATSQQKSPSKSPSKCIDIDRSTGSWMRYVVLLLTTACLSSVMANVVCFNFTVICMPAHGKQLNKSDEHNHDNHYSKNERTWLFSAVAIGALVSVGPVSVVISKWGSRNAFFCAGLLTGIATMLIPIAASTDFKLFIALRVLQGVSFAACMPTVGAVTSTWASLQQQGLFMATLTTFGQLSSVFAMPVSGQLCLSSWGWQSVFYVHGLITLSCFLTWFYFFTDSPDKNLMVSRRELVEIHAGKSSTNLCEDNKKNVPYREILTTPSIWAVWVGALGDLVALQLIHTFSPLYIREILGYTVEKTGFLAALPVLLQLFVKVGAGYSSDKFKCCSETFKLRMFNSLALCVSGILLLCAGFLVKPGQGEFGMTLIVAATGMFGFNGAGFNKGATLISRQYSQFVLATIQFIWCLSMLICPILVSLLLHKGTVEEWRLVFLAHALLLFVANTFFCVFATGRPAPWTDRSITDVRRKNMPLWTYHSARGPI